MTTKGRKTVGAVRPDPPALDKWRVINRLQLALLLGVHPDTVTDYSRGGMPVLTRGGRGRESAYDAIECLAWWRQQQGKNAKEAAQTRAYEATAKLNELKLKEKRRELLPRDQVALEGQHYTKAWAAKVGALPRRMVHAGLITPREESGVADLCRDILREIASWTSLADVKRAEKATS